MTTTAIVDAWINNTSDPSKLDDPKNLPFLHYLREGSDASYWKTNGYSYVGKATIILEPISQNEMIAAKAESIKAEIQKTRADFQVNVNRLEEQLSKLLALDFSGMVDTDDSSIPF